jgi:molybdenum cofactor cytidylyltransferase
MTSNSEVGIVLLAAGSSSRMGQNKMKLSYRGIPLIERALQAALNSVADYTVVVTGANREQNDPLIKQFDVKVVFNKKWESGIGSSVKCGLKRMLEINKNLNAVIISVCDQPHLSSEIFDRMIASYVSSGKKIVASIYGGTKGVPVLYDRIFFPDLMSIPDEHGAKQYLVENASEQTLATVDFTGGEVDIDTLEDFTKID